jgi:hypothetical protein
MPADRIQTVARKSSEYYRAADSTPRTQLNFIPIHKKHLLHDTWNARLILYFIFMLRCSSGRYCPILNNSENNCCPSGRDGDTPVEIKNFQIVQS